MKHTPTPWEIDEHDNTIIANIDGGYGDDGSQVRFDTICQFEDSYGDVLKNWRDNRRHVVKCVNCHDELIQVLEMALNYVRVFRVRGEEPLVGETLVKDLQQIESVIAKAKGNEQ